MKALSFIRLISVFSYLFIILAGEMIGIPFICWLLFTIFDFGNIDQVFAVLGIAGIVLNFLPWRNQVLMTLLSFIMMLSPIISRMVQVPLEEFNYTTFKIPVFLFVVCYLIFIILNAKKEKRVVSL